MDRTNHYEAAFAALLRQRRICHVAIDEARRSPAGQAATADAGLDSLKSLDFIVHSRGGKRWLVDVKGRRCSGGPTGQPRRAFESWATRDDVNCSHEWEAQFGPGYQALFVFTYHLPDATRLPPGETTWCWQGRAYLLRAVRVADYERHLRPRSLKWDTVYVPACHFRDLARPLHCFLPEVEDQSAGVGNQESGGQESGIRGLKAETTSRSLPVTTLTSRWTITRVYEPRLTGPHCVS